MTYHYGNPCESHLGHTHNDAPKKCYHSSREANRALDLIRKMGVRGEKKPTRAYCCPGCERWFLTSSPA